MKLTIKLWTNNGIKATAHLLIDGKPITIEGDCTAVTKTVDIYKQLSVTTVYL